nr:transposase [Streptomyces sp. RLB1-33]QIY76173.1 transposase [Streptomyces sp. RLB1-33]
MPTAAVIDSQTVRAADTVPTAGSGYDGGKKIKDRKRHIAVDTDGLLLAVVVTNASLRDRDGAYRIAAALREAFSRITLIWADAGHTGRFVRDTRNIWDLAVAIVKRPDRAKGFVLPHRRWVVERSFARLTKFRGLIRNSETLPATPEAVPRHASPAESPHPGCLAARTLSTQTDTARPTPPTHKGHDQQGTHRLPKQQAIKGIAAKRTTSPYRTGRTGTS